MKIEILGPGCPRCESLMENIKQALEQLGIEADVNKVTEMGQIVARGVMSTPGVVIDGKVVSTGKVLSVDEAKAIIEKLTS